MTILSNVRRMVTAVLPVEAPAALAFECPWCQCLHTGGPEACPTVEAPGAQYEAPFTWATALRLAAEPATCNWCPPGVTATRNLHTWHDLACEAHHAQHFAGPHAAPVCQCAKCEVVGRARRVLAAEAARPVCRCLPCANLAAAATGAQA